MTCSFELIQNETTQLYNNLKLTQFQRQLFAKFIINILNSH